MKSILETLRETEHSSTDFTVIPGRADQTPGKIQPGVSAKWQFNLLLGSGPFAERTERLLSDEEWSTMPHERRAVLFRLERFAQMYPEIHVGDALAYSTDPTCVVLDEENDQIILIKRAKQ